MKLNLEAKGIDAKIGARIRELRIERGLTQQRMSELLDLTYQQFHKYEKAINRVSAGRLYQIAGILGVPVQDLYVHVGRETPTPHRERRTLDLAREFVTLSEPSQDAVRALVRSLAVPVAVAAE